jgi:hypothetical protein
MSFGPSAKRGDFNADAVGSFQNGSARWRFHLKIIDSQFNYC